MEIRKETTITPLTTDGKPLVAGETVVMIADGKALVGEFQGMTARGAVCFSAAIDGEKVTYNLMPSSIQHIYKAQIVIDREEEEA